MLLSRDATQKKLEHPPPPQGHLLEFYGPPYSIQKKLKAPQFLLPPTSNLNYDWSLITGCIFLLFTSKWACNWGTCQ